MKSLRPFIIAVFILLFPSTWAHAQTFSAEYGSAKYDKEISSVNYTLSIPTRNGVQLSAIRGVVISNPGLGGNTARQVDERWEKWLYENGFAYIGNDDGYSTGSLSALTSFAGDDLGGITYSELAYVPVCVFGESAGGTATMSIVYNNPERVIAFAVEHTRFFSDVDDAANTPAVKAVPGYYRWGEWDHGRFNEGYLSAGGGDVDGIDGTSAKTAIHSMLARGAQWMTVIEHRQVHATKRYAFEETMGFFGLMLPLRYDYQQGVAGKDPKLGPVTLTPIAREDGYLGEHRYGAIQSKITIETYTDPVLSYGIDADNTYYPNFFKDWESRDPYYAPFADFTRIHKDEGHSWMANADVAAFWATKFSHGIHDLHVEFTDLISDAFGTEPLTKSNSLFPNIFNTAQSIRVNVDPLDFPNTERVEFYANSTLKGTVENAPFEFTYTFDSDETGIFALYPVAIAANGDRTVGPRRMVQVYPNTRDSNTAPEVQSIGKIEGAPGASLSIPFTVGDVDGDTLTVVWREVNRTDVTFGSYTATIGGSGNDRTLDLTLPPTPGIIWGIIQVSDGDISTNAYITIHATGDGSAAPFFVGSEAIGVGGLTGGEHIKDGWSRRVSVRVYDYDTDPRDLTLTVTSSDTNSLPNENIRVGGAGEYRYIQVKYTGYATLNMTLSDGNTSVSESFTMPYKTQDNTPPVISAIHDQTAYYSNESDPIEVRLYDLHTPSEELVAGEPTLSLSVTSGNQALIADANITVTQVGERRHITFTPAYNQTGTVTLTATVTDAEGLTASTTFDVAVSPPPALAADGGTLTNATITQVYDGELTATGGIQPYAWSLTSGALPAGLTLNADGTITGAPSVAGNFTFTAQATDSNPGGSVSQSGTFSLDVLSLLTPPQDFSAFAETNTTITLTWSDTASGEMGYAIERRTVGDVTWTPLTTTSANAITHTDSNALAAGTSYEYRLRAVGTHTGVYTDTVTVTAIGTPVISTQPQSTAVLSGNSAILSVSATGGNLSYQWYEGDSGITSSPVANSNAASLTVENVTAPRTFWVRVSNPAGQIDSTAATISISQQAPSLKVNLGADLGGTWNSYADFTAFNGNLSETYSNLIFDSGSSADGVSLTMTRTSTNASFCYAISDQTATAPTSDWLTDAAAQSFWFINLSGQTPSSQLTFSVAGLPAGTYDLEVYVYVNSSYGTPANSYKFNPIGILAGVDGTFAATENPINSAEYNATTTESTILLWTDLTVEAGNTLDLRTDLPLNSKMPVINAFSIRGKALAVSGPSIDTHPVDTSINEGETASLTVTATASEGSLSYQWYQGATGDTSTPVGTDSANFTTPALSQTTGYWVAVTDGTNNTIHSDTAVLTVQQSGPAKRIIFIGNSFTNGWTSPVQPYNSANVTDLNGSGYGGIPGILRKLADDMGYLTEVGIESVSGSTLAGRYPGKVDLVTDPTWDRYVLQGASTEAIADWRGDDATASQLNSTVSDWATAILAANASAEIWLYAPWASRKQIGDPVDGVTTYYTTAEGPATYLAEIYEAYNGAATTLSLDGWVPVGEAFEDAVENGLSDLWIADEHHANAVGSYLASVMFYRDLLGGDPRLLPTGPGSAADDLGLTTYQSETVHQLVYDFVLAAPERKPVISSSPADTTITEGESATLEVTATASNGGGSLSYQWYTGTSPDTSAPISGATGASYTTLILDSAGSYPYWVRVTDDNGFSDSATATVTANPAGGVETHWLFDFGSDSYLTAGNWNNLTTAGSGGLSNVVDDAGNTTAVSIAVTQAFSSVNANGEGSGAYPADAQQDSFFVTGTGTVGSSSLGQLTFSGLDDNATYDLILFGSRVTATPRTTRYSAGGQSVHLMTSGNTSTTVTLTGLSPTSGQLFVNVEPLDASGTQSEYGYLNIIELVEQSGGASTTFDSWASSEGLTGASALDTADPDGDGINNLLEYAFDLDPNASDSNKLPSIAIESDSGTDYLTLTYRKNLDAPDLTYTIEMSTTLVSDSWTAATVESDTVTTADPDGDGSSELRKARIALSGDKQFLRVKVTP